MNSSATEEKITLPLQGNLVQTVFQKALIDKSLKHVGISVIESGNYWDVQGTFEQIKQVLTAFWKNRVQGWYFYENELTVQYGICTEEEFKRAQ
jgi:hypothetical protein